MKPNKIETQIKEKLNSREIQPSAQAWDRLDAMLSIAEEKKTKPSFGWLYIAASILVFVTVGTFFYNQDGTNDGTTETVVVNESNTDTVNTTTNAVAEKEIESTVPSSEVPSSNKITNTKSNSSSITITNKSVIAQNEKSFTRGIAERSVANQNSQKTNNASIINKQKTIEFQISTDVALKNLPKTMTPNKEMVIAKNTNTNQDELVSADVKKSDNISKVKVNANSLLSEVDGELELTFREKVFKSVNKNYKEVKVALTNRNNL